MKTYFAITIGPILKTLTKARKTRELWAASYLFSYLMKQLIFAFKKNGGEFIVPFVGEMNWKDKSHNILEDPNEAGIFSDRCVFFFPDENSEKGNMEFIGNTVSAVKENLIEKIAIHLHSNTTKLTDAEKKNQEGDLKAYFKAYLQVYVVSRDFDTEDSKIIAGKLYADLNVLELQNQFYPMEKYPWMERFLDKASFRRHRTPSFLMKDAFGPKSSQKKRFESIIEISASEIIENINEADSNTLSEMIGKDEEESIVEFLAKINPDKFKTYHKYIAIIQADGDAIGKLIEKLGNDFIKFSKALMSYSLEANDLIREHGGLPVYLGGDDALFFAPLRYRDKDIFKLVDAIDELFQTKIKPLNIPNVATLSFGISIAYYKFPLAENLNLAIDSLFNIAKKSDFVNGEKNAVSVLVQKHSGQKFQALFQKTAVLQNTSEPSVYARFKELVRSNIDDDQFLNSVIYHLERDWPVMNGLNHDPERWKWLIKNNFNEDIHKQKDYVAFLEKLSLFVPVFAKTYKDDDLLEVLKGSLRLVKFLNRDDND